MDSVLCDLKREKEFLSHNPPIKEGELISPKEPSKEEDRIFKESEIPKVEKNYEEKAHHCEVQPKEQSKKSEEKVEVPETFRREKEADKELEKGINQEKKTKY